jgi:hypothetical protein
LLDGINYDRCNCKIVIEREKARGLEICDRRNEYRSYARRLEVMLATLPTTSAFAAVHKSVHKGE